MMRRNPGFTAIVILILAVAIGANTALFSVVNAVMLRPLPYKDSHQLVSIQERGPWLFKSRPNFFFIRENNEVFESLAGCCRRAFYVEGIETPHEIHGGEVTSNLFTMLGVPPILGRGFLPEDERPENPRVVVVSHDFWLDHLGGVPEAIGKSVSLTADTRDERRRRVFSRESYTVVGVMPAGFRFPAGRNTPLWRPILLTEGAVGPMPIPVFPVGRLKKGVTAERANADLVVLADRVREMDPEAHTERGRFGVERLLDGLVAGHRRLPLLLLGAAGFVLLIACSNIANLFLARASVRRREMAVRMALGASRRRIVRQVLTEGLLLSVGAGLLGLLLALGTVRGLVRLCPAEIPRLQETSVDGSVLGFTLGVSILTGLLFSLAPAWRASDVGVNEALKDKGGRTTGGRRWRRFHDGLVVSQLGLSVVLLIGATLLIRTLIALHGVDVGFRSERVLAVHIRLPKAKYTETDQFNGFFRSLLERLRSFPQARSSAAVYHAFSVSDAFDMTGAHEFSFSISGRSDVEADRSAGWVSVTPDFFETMGVKLLSGRAFADREEGAVVIDEVLARTHFLDVDPVGQRLITDDKSEHTIVGVMAPMRNSRTPDPKLGIVYGKGDDFLGFATILVRTDGDPTRLAPAIREQVAELEKDQVITQLEPLEATLSQMLAPRRFVMILLGLFAGIALALATVGVYGLLQYSTTQQTHDIGIRMALGARQADILWAVVGQGFRLTLLGVAIGVTGALLLTKVISSYLYGVTRTDPVTFACVSLALAGASLLAGYLPARRAARVDPMTALRYE